MAGTAAVKTTGIAAVKKFNTYIMQIKGRD